MKQALLNRLIGIVCLLFAGGLLLVAQNDLRFGSSETENLYALLPSGIKAALHHQTASGDSGIVFSSQLGKNRLTFSAGYNDIGELSHLGIFIKHADDMDSGLLPAQQYISRSLLKWALREHNPRLFDKVPFGHSLLKINGRDVASAADLPSTGSLLRDTALNFQISKTGNQFAASCRIDHFQAMELQFPSDYFEISGKRKDELEKELIRLLATHKSIEPKQPGVESRQPVDLKNGLFRLAGPVYDGSEDINADLYFVKNNSYTITYSSKYPHESISNLLLGYAFADVRANVDIIAYEGKVTLENISLPALINFLGTTNNSFLGWQERDQPEIAASVFFVNPYYDYNHLLVVNAAVDSFFSTDKNIKATLYVYISKSGQKHQ